MPTPVRARTHTFPPDSGLAQWLEWQSYSGRRAWLRDGARVYEVRLLPNGINPRTFTMAKKAATQVIDALHAATVNELDQTCTITLATRDRCIRLLKRVDARDEQNQKRRKVRKPHKAGKR